MEPDAFLQERRAEKDAAIAEIRAAIDRIERERGEPDEWQRFYLAHAFVMMFAGAYNAAPVDVKLAMLPPGDRIKSVEVPALFGTVGVEVLREALRVVDKEPVRTFPHIGPVRLAAAQQD